MPHLVHDCTTLDRLYPSLQAPDDESLDDWQCDSNDAVLRHGMRLAEHIREETTLQGRRRRPDTEARHDGGGTGGDDDAPNTNGQNKLSEQGLQRVSEAAPERTTRSARCPRRSAKRSYLPHHLLADGHSETSQSSGTTSEQREHRRSFSSRLTVRTASPRGPRGDKLASPGGAGLGGAGPAGGHPGGLDTTSWQAPRQVRQGGLASQHELASKPG